QFLAGESLLGGPLGLVSGCCRSIQLSCASGGIPPAFLPRRGVQCELHLEPLVRDRRTERHPGYEWPALFHRSQFPAELWPELVRYPACTAFVRYILSPVREGPCFPEQQWSAGSRVWRLEPRDHSCDPERHAHAIARRLQHRKCERCWNRDERSDNRTIAGSDGCLSFG